MNIRQILKAVDRAHFRAIQEQCDLDAYVGWFDLKEQFPPDPIFDLEPEPGVN